MPNFVSGCFFDIVPTSQGRKLRRESVESPRRRTALPPPERARWNAPRRSVQDWRPGPGGLDVDATTAKASVAYWLIGVCARLSIHPALLYGRVGRIETMQSQRGQADIGIELAIVVA